MDKAEARLLIERELEALRRLAYSELCARIPPKRQNFLFKDIVEAIQAASREVTADSGAVYRVETMVMWDDKADGDIRVIVAVDDAHRSAFVSVTGSFIMARDGRFVDKLLSDG